jgi:Tol biopolymer transport system component
MVSRFIQVVAYGLLLLAAASGQGLAAGFSPSIGPVAWSPDGEQIVFTIRDKGVFTVNMEGEQTRVQDTDRFSRSVQWSPDGGHILSTLTVDDQAQIYLTSLADGDKTALTEDVGFRPNYYAPGGIDAQYAPNGEQIAFLSLREGDDYLSLYVMNADGSEQQRLTSLGTVEGFAWSPDGQKLAFGALPGGYNGTGDLFIINRDGSDLRQLTQSGEVIKENAPTWAPDGEELWFTTLDGVIRKVERVNTDRSGRQVIREDAAEPLFSPLGDAVLITTYDGNWPGLAVMTPDGGDVIPIRLSGERAYYNAAWSPTGGQIAFVTYLFGEDSREEIVVANMDGTNPVILVHIPT